MIVHEKAWVIEQKSQCWAQDTSLLVVDQEAPQAPKTTQALGSALGYSQ